MKTVRPKLSILHEEIPDQLKQFMQMTRVAEKAQYAAEMAHEVNNPLTAVLGCAENIELMLQEPVLDREAIRLQILEILKSSHRASNVIKKMGQLNRSETGNLVIVDIAELALNAVEYVKKQMRNVQAEFIFEFNKPIPVQCDPTQIEQIIINVLTNALHALSRVDGQRQLKISFSSSDVHQKIRIWNNGPAIPKDIHDKLMTPFFSAKAKGEGMGLGLSISKAIMLAHEGELDFHSSDGMGTEFVLTFPRIADEPWPKQLAPQSAPILIIDAQENFRRTLAEKFKILGFDTVAVDNMAIAFASENSRPQFSCAILDIIPGSEDSLSALKQLRHSLGPSAPIFTISSYPSTLTSHADLKNAGATNCFNKPLRIEQFSSILSLIHRGKKASDG